jgi:hypothetical protein
MSEGFFFRHDSIKNIGFERQVKERSKRMQSALDKVREDLTGNNLIRNVVDKITS